jgi:hypothetical protein
MSLPALEGADSHASVAMCSPDEDTTVAAPQAGASTEIWVGTSIQLDIGKSSSLWGAARFGGNSGTFAKAIFVT